MNAQGVRDRKAGERGDRGKRGARIEKYNNQHKNFEGTIERAKRRASHTSLG